MITNSQLTNNTNAYKAILVFMIFQFFGMYYLYYGKKKPIEPHTTNQIVVSYVWPNKSAESIEANVTSVYESAICVLKGIDGISSTSYSGSGVINITVDRFTNVHQLRYEISTLLQTIFKRMPQGISYPIVTVIKEDEIFKNRIVEMKLLLTGQITARVDSLKNIISTAFKNVGSKVIFPAVNSLKYTIRLKENILAQNKISHHELFSTLNICLQKQDMNVNTILENGISSSRFMIKGGISLTDLENLPINLLSGKRITLRHIAWITPSDAEIVETHKLNGYNVVDFQIVTKTGSVSELLVVENIRKSLKPFIGKEEYIIDIGNKAYEQNQLKVIFFCVGLFTVLIISISVFVCSQSLSLTVGFLCCVLSTALTQLIIVDFLPDPFPAGNITVFVLITALVGARLILLPSLCLDRGYVPDFRLIPDFFIVITLICLQLYLGFLSDRLAGLFRLFIPSYTIAYLTMFFVIPAISIVIPQIAFRDIRRIYFSTQIFLTRYRYLEVQQGNWNRSIIFLLILTFGVPTFLMPRKLEPSALFASIYNSTLGHDFYTLSVKKYVDVAFGGTTRFFFEAKKKATVKIEDEDMPLNVDVKFPSEADPVLIEKLRDQIEKIVSRYHHIRKMEIKSSPSGNIVCQIWFFPAAVKNGVPLHLKNVLQRFAVDDGFATFRIEGWGVTFDNSTIGESKAYGIIIKGYQYKNLEDISHQIMTRLAANPRIRDIEVANERYEGNLNRKYIPTFSISQVGLAQGVRLGFQKSLMEYLGRKDYKGQEVGYVLEGNSTVPLILKNAASITDQWNFISTPISIINSASSFKMSSVGYLSNVRSNAYIQRIDQQYKLAINYNYLGDDFIASLARSRIIDSVKSKLPIGYYISENKAEPFENSESSWAAVCSVTLVGMFMFFSIVTNSFIFSIRVVFFMVFSIAGALFLISVTEAAPSFKDYGIFAIIPIFLAPGALENINRFTKTCWKKRGIQLRFLMAKLCFVLGLIPIVLISNNHDFQFHLCIALMGVFLFSIVLYCLFLTFYKFD